MLQTPVALFVYNRPWHTRQAVDALRANRLAAATPLYVFADAARSEAHRPAVEEVRAYLPSISGFASVSIIQRDSNLGLARSIIDGVSRLCDEYGKVIVLEDDLVTSPHFLDYMNDALNRYTSDDRVMQIAGYMFPARLDTEDALFLPFTSSWGWATWQRAWRRFDPGAPGFAALQNDESLRKAFDLGDRYPYFRMLESQRRGETDSWAIRWYLTVFLEQGLTLYPRKTLVRNLGFDGSGVNCAASSIGDDHIDAEFTVRTYPGTIELTSAYAQVLDAIPKPRFRLKTALNRLVQLAKQFWYEKTR